MVLQGRDITILGAGIGGLTAALALAQKGAKVTVLEQAPVLAEVGAGLQISPNGVRVLDALGLGPALRAAGLPAGAVVLCDATDGAEVLRMPLPAEPGYFFLHRADLLDLIAAAAREAGVTLRLSHRVEGVEICDTAGVKLKLAGGRELRPGLLVGADGLHSQVRKAVARPGEPFFTGQVAWRMTVPAGEAPASDARVYMGPNRHVVSYPLRGGTLRNIVAVEERETWAAEGWHHEDDPARVRRAFSAFCPEVRDWLKAARDVRVWGLFRHEVALQWHRGSAVILGDAAHPTLPFLAQGANLAIEDAWVLAAALEADADLDVALERYQALRRPRVQRAVAAANANAQAYHLPEGLRRSFAYTGLRMLSKLAPTMPLRRFDWLYGEDVTRL